MYIQYKQKNSDDPEIYLYRLTDDMERVLCLKNPDVTYNGTYESSEWVFNIDNHKLIKSRFHVDILTEEDVLLELI